MAEPARRNIGGADAARQRAAARVRLAGGALAPLGVGDVDAPAALRGAARDAGWRVHAVRFDAADLERASPPVGPGVVEVPNDPALARAAPRRVAAFLAGRYCAARALGALGLAPAPVPVGVAGAPVWPAGAVGSISHAPERAVAVAARADVWRGVGVDCEALMDAAQAASVGPLVLAEADEVDPGPLARPALVTAGFSAKESLYKCLRPLVGAFFDFHDARLTRVAAGPADANGEISGALRLVLARDLAPGFRRGCAFEVAVAITRAHVYTWLALRADGAGAGGP